MNLAETYRGKPCIKGHFTRYVSNSNCVECKRENDRARMTRPEIVERKKKQKAENREKQKESGVVHVNVPGWGCLV